MVYQHSHTEGGLNEYALLTRVTAGPLEPPTRNSNVTRKRTRKSVDDDDSDHEDVGPIAKVRDVEQNEYTTIQTDPVYLGQPPKLDSLPRSLHVGPAAGAPKWAALMPAVFEHYATNEPDYSGAKMYQMGANVVGKYTSLVRAAPENVTIATLVGETTPQPWCKTFNLPYSFILELRSSVYQTLNQKLSDPKEVSRPTLSMSILALARYEAFASTDSLQARTHLLGLRRLMDSQPNINTLPHPWLRYALLWCDRAVSMFSGKPLIFHQPVNAYCNPASPFVSALAPKSSDFELGRWRRIITSFYRSPGAELISILSQIREFSAGLDQGPSGEPVLQSVLQIRNDLLLRSPGMYEDILVFSEPRFAMQRLAYECLRMTGLLLTSAILEKLRTKTIISSSAIDHDAMALLMLDISLLGDHNPACAMFVSSIGAAFTHGVVQQGAKAEMFTTAERLGLQDWNDIKSYLENRMYYYKYFQDAFGQSLSYGQA